jgi:Rrf2 family nitric oxide-sensitive transcriptional repressor
MKVAQHLAASGDVITLRGQHGGLRLARPAAEIRLGNVIRGTEPDVALVPWTDSVLQAGGVHQSVLDRAMAAFMAVLDGHSVADLIASPGALTPLLLGTSELGLDGL